MTRVILRALVAFAAIVCGCEAVPDLTFPPDAPPDSVDEAQPPADDAGLGSCPDAAAAGYACCGTIPCFGDCPNMCAACMKKDCMQGTFCCAKTNGNATCLQPNAHCQP
jgi:hypothetical protein